MLRILFCGGGSVGHLAPAVAVWETLNTLAPQTEALFVCARRGADRSYLRTQGVRFASIDAPKWALSPLLPLFPLLFLLSLVEAAFVLVPFRPQIIVAKGGYVSVSVCLVGWLLRIPIVLHESDCALGRANSFLLRFARHLCIGTPQKTLPESDRLTRLAIPVTATGNPIRASLLRGSRDAGRRITGFSGKKPVLLVIGGSQGSRALNALVHAHLGELLDFCDVIHSTGKGKGHAIEHARYVAREFVEEELPDFYALADIVLSRAGASVLAELSALGKAVILVPLPDIAHEHQGENARFLEVANAAVVIPQERLEETLLPTVKELVTNERRRRELGERLHTFAVPDAAEKIARIIMEEAKQSSIL